MIANLNVVLSDLRVPPLSSGPPAAGKRVRDQLPQYAGTAVHHGLYLPNDWKPGKKYPLIVEYAGNAGYRNAMGDACDGTVESCQLGYGISGGVGFLWLCLPFVDGDGQANAGQWWGDVRATVEYCRKGVAQVCSQFGGDAEAVVLAGFSRGAIGCNFIGLHDDSIASLWCAFVTHSHYDGLDEHWGYAGADRAAALKRLQRLGRRPVWHSHEISVARARRYIADSGSMAPFTFTALPFANHSSGWVLRDIPERESLRRWVKRAVTQPLRPAWRHSESQRKGGDK